MEIPIEILEELRTNTGETEDALKEKFSEQILSIIRKNYDGQINITLDSISKLSPSKSSELKLKKDPKEIYEILVTVENKDTGGVARSGLILRKSSNLPLEKRVCEISNGLPPSNNYIFSSEKRPIQVFPKYLTLSGNLGELFDKVMSPILEKKGYILNESIENIDIVKKISNSGEVRLLDMVGAFDPLILLHEKIASQYKNEIAFISKTKKPEDYLREMMEGMEKIYRDVQNKNEVADDLLGMIHKYFMPDNLQTVIHNTTPYHNMMLSLVNPSTLTIGPRTIDLGALIGWPEIFNKFYDSEYIAQNLIQEGYLWKRDKMFNQFKVKSGDPDPKLLEEGTYFGSIYMICREGHKLNLDNSLLHSTILKQLEILAKKRIGEANSLHANISGYKPANKLGEK